MRIKLFSLFAVGILFFSCAPAKEEDATVPDHILSEEQFVLVLTDAYLSESASGLNIKNATGEKFDSTYLFNPLKERNISRPKFDSAMVWYSQHPKKLKLVYDKVLERLSKYQSAGTIVN